MKPVLLAAALVAAFVAGTLAPRASAWSESELQRGLRDVVSELRGIRQAIERGHR